MNCQYFDSRGEQTHVWTFAGNPEFLPFRGMKCDCGLIEYGVNDCYNLPTDLNVSSIKTIYIEEGFLNG